jgi:hypothetical protein
MEYYVGDLSDFVHRDTKKAVAPDACLAAQGPGKGLAQSNSDIFVGVVNIHVQISSGVNLQVKEPVLGQKREHMIQKRHPGSHPRRTLAVNSQSNLDIRF